MRSLHAVTGATFAPRRAEPRDLSALLELWLALTRHHAELDARHRLLPGAEDEVRRLLEAQLADPEAASFLLDAAAGPAGFASVRVDRAPPIHAETRRAEITDLYVAPGARRRGAGRRLVEAATGWAAGRGAPRLEVRVVATNPAGRAFWQALGFGACVDVLERHL